MMQSPLSEANSHSASQEIPKLIIMFTRAHHWSLSWARCVQSILNLQLWVSKFRNKCIFCYMLWYVSVHKLSIT